MCSKVKQIVCVRFGWLWCYYIVVSEGFLIENNLDQSSTSYILPQLPPDWCLWSSLSGYGGKHIVNTVLVQDVFRNNYHPILKTPR